MFDPLQMRQLEPTCLGRDINFNKTTGNEFFSNLKSILQKKNFEPEAIFNNDEADISTIQQFIK